MYDDIQGIRQLAIAVTQQAVDDYISNKCDYLELERYVLYSPFFQVLGYDEKTTLRKIKKRKTERYGKKKNS